MEAAGVNAIFPDQGSARDAAGALLDAGFDASAIHVGSPERDPAAARVEVRAESETLTASDPEGDGIVMTNLTLWRGAILGGLIGIALGLVIFGLSALMTEQLPGGAATFLGAALGGSVAALSLVGALIGAYWSFKARRQTTERRMHEEHVVQISVDSPDGLQRAREILLRAGARHVEEALPKNVRFDDRRAG